MKTVIGLFDDYSEAERAVFELLDGGLAPAADISVIARDEVRRTHHREPDLGHELRARVRALTAGLPVARRGVYAGTREAATWAWMVEMAPARSLCPVPGDGYTAAVTKTVLR